MNKPAKGVVFRVASQARVGGGHVSRCLAVARALADTVPVLMVLDPSAEASVAGTSLVGVDQSRVKGVDPGLINLVKESLRFRNQGCPEQRRRSLDHLR